MFKNMAVIILQAFVAIPRIAANNLQAIAQNVEFIRTGYLRFVPHSVN